MLRLLMAESTAVLVFGTLAAVAQAAMLVPIALVVKRVFDHDLPDRHVDAVVWDGLLVVALYCANAALGYLSRAWVLRNTTAVARRLRVELVSHLYALPQAWHDEQATGALHSLAVQDTERIDTAVAELANPILPAVLTAVGLIVVALVVSPTLFLVLVAIVPALLLIWRWLGQRVTARAIDWSRASRGYSADTQLQLRAMTLTRIQGAEPSEVARTDDRARALAEGSRALGVARASYATVQNAVGAVAGTAVLIVGGIGVARHTMTLGDLLSFYAVLALLLRQIHVIGWGANTLIIGAHSMRRVDQLLDTDIDDHYQRGTRRLDFRGEVAIERVSFGYGEDLVIRDVELTMRACERVALVGPNGAGKSTIVSLVMGLYRPRRGRLLADGIPFEELDLRLLRRQIGVVLQDPVLFPGTIRDNIVYGREDASDAEVAAAAFASTAADQVEALPHGYQTAVGDEGLGLSGGLRQRVAIARALVGRPALLVLDEPTTYLDEATVRVLMARLASLAHQPTVLLVTHDPHVAAHVDRVVEIREGRVVSDAATQPDFAR
jgi:ATP-binding cassette, subfamily B, bacterial